MKQLLLLLLLFIANLALAQSNEVLNNKLSYAVLPDSGYSFNQVLTNRNLTFVVGDSLRPYKVATYWLKITIDNPGSFAEKYAMRLNPALLNTFYYYDANAKKWLSTTSGIKTGEGNGISDGYATNLVMQAQAINTVYVKMQVGELKKYNLAIQPTIRLKSQSVTDKRLNITVTVCLVAILVLFIFFLSNLYLYLSSKITSILYYLVAQVGGILYIATYWEFSQAGGVLTTALFGHVVRYYSCNTLLMHVAIVLVLWGLVQLTRSYLNTKQYLPKLDALLKYSIAVYIILSAILMSINSFWFFIEDDTVVFDNIYVLLLLLSIIYTSVSGYILKLRASGTFLLANLLTMLLMVGIAIFHVFITTDSLENVWLPSLTVVSEAFAFSVALVARTRLIEKELNTKEMEAQQLTYELREIALQHSMVELENEKINGDIQHEKTRNELLQQKLATNQRELAANALYTVQKNEMLEKLKTEITELKKLYPGRKHQQLAGMEKILQTNLDLDDDWGKFKLHFEQVNPLFFDNLVAKYPSLTKNDMRLCAYFHINLSTKEIAAMLNITPASVRQAKMRLYKKMGREAATDDEDGEA